MKISLLNSWPLTAFKTLSTIVFLWSERNEIVAD